ncbi:MAG: hypothetical protein D6703_04980, partial [Zetaproteobacteria bacterium]
MDLRLASAASQTCLNGQGLFFQNAKYSVGSMSIFGQLSKRMRRRLSALSMGVFALQVLAAGFCLL